MTANAYTERALVEQSAMELLGALDWATAGAMDPVGANREVYRLLKEGLKITPPSRVAPMAGIDSCRVPLE